MSKGEAFQPYDCEVSEGALTTVANHKGWVLVAYRIDFHGQQLEFIQFNSNGQASYMKLDGDEFVAGPFGGGYSWALPKYVVAAGEKLARETFILEPALSE